MSVRYGAWVHLVSVQRIKRVAAMKSGVYLIDRRLAPPPAVNRASLFSQVVRAVFFFRMYS